MKLRDYLIESKNKPLIVVDVQPAYKSYITFDVVQLMELINGQTGKILFLINADEQGLTEDSVMHCWQWWWENGLELDNRDRRATVFDKGYGHFRSWMDYLDDDALMIKAIRFMHQKKENDSRDIDPEEWKEALGEENWKDYMEDDLLSINWVSLKTLKQHARGYICGGGKNECLREVTLYMNAFNLKTKEIRKFIYG